MLVHLISPMCFWRKTPHFVPFAALVKHTRKSCKPCSMGGKGAIFRLLALSIISYSCIQFRSHWIFLQELALAVDTCFHLPERGLCKNHKTAILLSRLCPRPESSLNTYGRKLVRLFRTWPRLTHNVLVYTFPKAGCSKSTRAFRLLGLYWHCEFCAQSFSVLHGTRIECR